jgi:hypothetical protein
LRHGTAALGRAATAVCAQFVCTGVFLAAVTISSDHFTKNSLPDVIDCDVIQAQTNAQSVPKPAYCRLQLRQRHQQSVTMLSALSHKMQPKILISFLRYIPAPSRYSSLPCLQPTVIRRTSGHNLEHWNNAAWPYREELSGDRAVPTAASVSKLS